MANIDFRAFQAAPKPVISNAASDATPMEIPFESPAHLEFSGGVTDKCFFLRNKVTGEVRPWNEADALNGRIFWYPEYNLKLLDDPDFADYREVLRRTKKAALLSVEHLLSSRARASSVEAVARQIDAGEVNVDHVDLESLPEIHRNGGDLADKGVSQVVDAVQKRRGRPPKEA